MRSDSAGRIGIVVHDFAAGGTERIAVRLANHWLSAGREVTIFCGDGSGLARAMLDAGVSVVEATSRLPRSWLSRRWLGRALQGLIAQRPVDVLIAPGNFHLPVVRAAGRLSCPVVCKLSNPLRRPGRGRLAQYVFERGLRRAARHVDTFVAMSPALAAEARGLIASPIEVLAEPILTAPALPRHPSDRPVILCAARMVPQKRLDLAVAAVAAGPSNTRLVILGDGPMRAELEAQAAAAGLGGRVRFGGQVPDIAPWLAQASVFLLSSAYEGYPAVLVESIAAGVPVVTTDCSPAIRELVVHPSFGRIVGSTPAALAAGLSELLGSAIDPGARAALVEMHDAGRCAAAWLATLDRVVAQQGA